MCCSADSERGNYQVEAKVHTAFVTTYHHLVPTETKQRNPFNYLQCTAVFTTIDMPPKASSGSSGAPNSPVGKSVPSPPVTTHSNSSDSASTVKVSSPLNPARTHSRSPHTTPTQNIVPLPSITSSHPAAGHTPVQSFSAAPAPAAIRLDLPPSHQSDALLTRISSNPLPNMSSSSSLSTIAFGRPASSFRSRSASHSRSRDASPTRGFVGQSVETEKDELPHGSAWWNRKVDTPRPWTESTKRKRTVPTEQTEGYIHTRQRVIEATASVLGMAAQVAHEALFAGVDLLRFAPVPGLEVAGSVLLNIWDALEMVEMNRLACLRLTERCADILISVRQEIIDAGNAVSNELQAPIAKLNTSFENVYVFLQKQAHRPFLHRYLKRDEILRSIAYCDAGLSDALGMFGVSIQIRTLKLVQANEVRRAQEHAAMVAHMELQGQQQSSTSPPEPLFTQSDSTKIRELLHNLRQQQNEHDQAQDLADLRQLMHTALQTNSDVAMIEVLQVGRDEMPEAIKTLQRALEREMERQSEEESEATARASPFRPRGKVTGRVTRGHSFELGGRGACSDSPNHARDTLDREFMEGGIDALRRLSKTEEMSLPSWTITRFEIDLEEKIGIGFFSDVYKSKWREHTVAIKVLAETTPRKLFVREIGIWKTLAHPNVLELLGASSASGSQPWFFVSPYYSNGSLVKYLKDVPHNVPVDFLKMIHEVAKGMAYLHEKGVLHGDLKAANVLVDDRLHCVISDFGQSEMKSEAYRISGYPLPHGTLRWQAPEMMSGAQVLTQQIDVYAFAIVCVEILTRGNLPWPMMDDEAVRRFVLVENMRPSLPLFHLTGSQLKDIIHAAWDFNPAFRPSFRQISKDIEKLRIDTGSSILESPRPPKFLDQWADQPMRPSPDMHPVPLPNSPTARDDFIVGSVNSTNSSDATFEAAKGRLSPMHGLGLINPEEYIVEEDISHASKFSARTSRSSTSLPNTMFDESTSESSLIVQPSIEYDSPPPLDERMVQIRDERRYRMLLQHDYHTSLTLPLWSPVPIQLGAVGYLARPEGTFVTLFNSFDPANTSDGHAKTLPNLYGYGKISQGRQRQDKRNAAQRGYDLVQGFLTKGRDASTPPSVSRTHSFQLRMGHKVAYLYTETTMYRYVEDLDAPKKWFQGSIDHILELYGREHKISKEDVYLVIGTLDAPDYALFVSHSHPDGQVNFNVYTGARPGEKWGAFSTTTADLSSSIIGGPMYREEMIGDSLSASKVSQVKVSSSSAWDTVLLARLRFKTDAAEPTSL
ncbi:hypothetical protein EW146_g5999 [Bondarzewia mesenterica]|uniref:Protein kinase domain-containing protein n=1 Tax=Bondarzewia mesenterica TaxID=1095465 RepID=A0A4S4LPX3_9AGAM|nr:hypothetical protein EW146_g5999 [Bondarzewia mesenterica]